MIPSYKIYKKGAKPKVKKIDPNDPFYIALLESVREQQEEILKMKRVDPLQLLQRITI